MLALYRFQRCAFDKNLRRICLQAEVLRAAKALAANPRKSDRAIAAEIGVDQKTVGGLRLVRRPFLIEIPNLLAVF
jgi:hypothetical protein